MGGGRRSRRAVLQTGALGLAAVLAGCTGSKSTESTGTPASSPTTTWGAPTPTATDEPTDAPTQSATESSTETPTESPTEYPTETPIDPPEGTRVGADTRFFSTLRTNETVIEGGIGESDQREFYATLITSEAETDRFNPNVLDDETVAFVGATSFPEWVLLVAQRELHSSTLQLRLNWAILQNDALTARVETYRDAITNAVDNATLVARLHLDGNPVPDGGEVTFVDYEEKTTRVEIQ